MTSRPPVLCHVISRLQITRTRAIKDKVNATGHDLDLDNIANVASVLGDLKPALKTTSPCSVQTRLASMSLAP